MRYWISPSMSAALLTVRPGEKIRFQEIDEKRLREVFSFVAIVVFRADEGVKRKPVSLASLV